MISTVASGRAGKISMHEPACKAKWAGSSEGQFRLSWVSMATQHFPLQCEIYDKGDSIRS